MPLLLPGIGVGADRDAVAYDDYDDYDRYDEPEPRPATRRRGAIVALAAAVAVAVVATAAVATGLLDDGGETDDRAAVPTVTTSASENIAVSEEPSTPPSTSASASASASRTASASPSPSAVRTTQVTTTAPAAPPSPTATRTTSAPTPSATEESPGPTLRYGDSGAEVEELQRRLTQAWAYNGPIDGQYSRQVRRAVEKFQDWQYIEEDEKGVYGPETRQALEAQTAG